MLKYVLVSFAMFLPHMEKSYRQQATHTYYSIIYRNIKYLINQLTTFIVIVKEFQFKKCLYYGFCYLILLFV